MKKIFPLLVTSILILGGIGASATNFFNETAKSNMNSDELDQYQDIMTENLAIPVGQIPVEPPINIQLAQSFIPSIPMLTRVELFIGKNITATYPLNVSIREELTGDDLTVTSVDPGLVPTQEYGWVEIDLNDIVVTIGQTYYLVALTENTTDNYYAWGGNNISESYPYGCMWHSIDDGVTWGNDSTESNPCIDDLVTNTVGQKLSDDEITWDMCFRTYGTDNLPPNEPVLDGTTSGKTGTSYDYTVTADDPDGDDVYYIIDWDDNTSDTIGPFASGTPGTISHTWDEDGTYIVKAKAKDINDAESNWVELTVTMPVDKIKTIQSIFINILQKYPYMFPILRYLLGL